MAVIDRRVATIGDNCIDFYVPPIGLAAVGGQALNVAIHWRNLGLVSEYLGAIGDDEDGARVMAALRTAGVIADRVRVQPGITGITHFTISTEGERRIVHEELGVCADYAPTPGDLDHLASAEYVHCAQLSDVRTPARELSRRGVPVSYDFSIVTETEDLDCFDVVFYGLHSHSGDEEAVALATQAIRAGAGVAVVTRGAQGSLAFDGHEVVRVPAAPADPVDTCGAGDSFAATFLARRLDGASIDTCLREASVAASKTVGHLGAWPQQLEPRTEVTG